MLCISLYSFDGVPVQRREEGRMKRSQKNTEKIKRPSSDKSEDVLCHALLTPLSSARREEKNEGKRKEVKTTINNKTKQQIEPG